MARILFRIGVLLVVVSVWSGAAQTVSLKTVQNNSLFFAGADLTNDIPGLTNTGTGFQIAAVEPLSARGGRVSLVNTQVWAKMYQGQIGLPYQARRGAVDAAGNFYFIGPSSNPEGESDFATIKSASDGRTHWVRTYDGPAHDADYPRFLAVDAAGDVFVTGESRRADGGFDVVTLKYSSNGTPLWTNRYNYPGAISHSSVGIVVAQATNAYVLVGPYGADKETAYITLKYDALGNTVWTNRYKGATNGWDTPVGLAADRAGNIFVTGGSSWGVLWNYRDGIDTVKYSSDGAGIWTNRYETLNSNARGIAVDSDGNVIVTGDVSIRTGDSGAGSGILDGCAAVKYTSDGTPLWTNVVGRPTYSGGNVPEIAADLSGNVFHFGGSHGTDSRNADFTTTKISPHGNLLWTNRFAELGRGLPIGGVATDPAGNFYFAAHSEIDNHDLMVLKYAGDGSGVWTNRFNGSASSSEYVLGITVDATGSLYVLGGTGGGALVVKYSDYIYYTPPANFTGTDTLTFTVADSVGNRSTALFSFVVSPPALQFDAKALQFTTTGMRLRIDRVSGTGPVVLYTSTNLVDWTPSFRNFAASGAIEIIDTNTARFPNRFYRAASGLTP